MTVVNHEDQLELFDLASAPVPRPPREMLGRMLLHLRHDQLVLSGIIGLIGLTVVFACGVERGKQLVRAELFAQGSPVVATGTASGSARPAMKTGERAPESVPAVSPPAPKTTQPKKPLGGRSRYAVQVVTYSRPQLAKLELDRLKASGEAAFLVIRDGRTRVYVGPFPSRSNADKKLAQLKTRYQDCFVRAL